jgi:RHS repeat-associated protein
MAQQTGANSKDSRSAESSSPVPSISLPKGGGAIRGIGEKFAANPITGTGSLTVPIYTSPGRSGFGPQLSLSYDSGAGNGPFGFGWSLALPSITRKTDKGLPQYVDAEESDIFILSGAEDLVPLLLLDDGKWIRDVSSRTVYGKEYGIHRYRPRVEGLFARIERWVNLSDPQDTFWRSISKDNITTWYGKTAESRIADPSDATRIFTWLICESYDDKGNVAVYQYKQENSEGVNLSQAHEHNRSDTTRSANRYIKHVFYGNRTPYFPDLTAGAAVPLPTDWCFELVFDYGEHGDSAPIPQETGKAWHCRPDPFATYRATFEVRSYRLCRRVLMFHHFAGEPGVGPNCLVRSTDLSHRQPTQPAADPTKPFYSYLLSVTQTGYRRNADGGYLSKALPPLEFEYTDAVIDETVREIDFESLRNLPAGIDGVRYQWVDLDGEGLSGILTEQAGSWFYKPNQSPVNLYPKDGRTVALAQFGPVELVARQPSIAALASGRQHLLSLSGDGQLDLVAFDGPAPGFFERTDDKGWAPFTPFTSLPMPDWQNPNLKFVDLTGDGLADLLISQDDVFWWHASLGAAGFGPGQRVRQFMDEEKGPKLVFSDGTESIFLADMSGDGLADIVRIRNGEVCYWPNLGYGGFGAKVTMDQAPWFDSPDLFDGRRIRLADIDGSGTADIIYFAGGGVHLYFNQSGNAWGARRLLNEFPPVESMSSAAALDLLGNGTVCLTWSSPLLANVRRPMRYVDLMGGQKPHLLVRVTNNLGAETRVQYAPSTRFYVADKLAGTPWLTRIPFPVQLVECVETFDWINRNYFVSRYAYHHGFYDGIEREFRGFGRVDQWDTEEFDTLTAGGPFPIGDNIDVASHVPPVLTRTWFHTGVYFAGGRISKRLEEEYYREGDASGGLTGLTDAQLAAMELADSALPAAVTLPDGSALPWALSGDDLREACRALRGSILRQEVYGLDGSTAAERPYTVSERNYTVHCLQPHGANRHAAFLTQTRETVDFHYERVLYAVSDGAVLDPATASPTAAFAADPRVSHKLTLAIDGYGNVLRAVAVGYGRRYDDFDAILTADDKWHQKKTLVTYTEQDQTNAVFLDDAYRGPLPAETRVYELLQLTPPVALPGVTALFRFDALAGQARAASDGHHDLPFQDFEVTYATSSGPYRRLMHRTRTIYRNADLTGPLPFGTIDAMALPHDRYSLALTAGLLAAALPSTLDPAPAEVIGAEGGYVDLDADGNWWTPAGRLFYSPGTTDTATQELAYASRHFYRPCRFEDSFGNTTTVTYDGYDLLLLDTRDPLDNRITAGERNTTGAVTILGNDYRVLAPTIVMDPNRNRTAMAFDVLGLVVGTAIMGKPEEMLGDSLAGFVTDLDDATIAVQLADPLANPGAILQQATTRLLYDLSAYQRTQANPAPTPAVVCTFARETHQSDLAEGQTTALQVTFAYSDGFGRDVQRKVRAEPGPVVDGGTVVTPRWVGTGWTIFNNKGKPVRQYEPFFSATQAFEAANTVGVSPILCYDPAGRIVATIHPNHTYEKVVFDPWRQSSWDVNDTVTQVAPQTDPDIGDFFRRLPVADYLPTWLTRRQSGALGSDENAAASKAAVHANTPTVAFFDTVGHTFMTVAHNRFVQSDSGATVDERYATRVQRDVEGNIRAVTDPQGRVAVRFDYTMAGARIHQASMEGGDRWMLNDIAAKPVYSWNSRGYTFHSEYDALRRPTQVTLSRQGAANQVIQRNSYGEGQPTPEAANLRGQAYQVFDGAGVAISRQFDFKGNLLQSSRKLAAAYRDILDWSAPVALEPETYTSSSRFDALNRVVALITPDQSFVRITYNEANLLTRIEANLRGATNTTTLVGAIEYNAKGHRTLVQYGNGVKTTYTYDPETLRLTRLQSTRGAAFLADCPNPRATPCGIQNLSYAYDPVGNITSIRDVAQPTIFFNNAVVTADGDYTYDAVYRLIAAAGREHAAVATTPQPTWNDAFRVGLSSPQDGSALRRYNEQYRYDAAGNIEQLVHEAAGGSWTRNYTYREASALDAGVTSNRLTSTQVGTFLELYSYDAHGNIVAMPHLSAMGWDYADRLQLTARQVLNDGVPETTFYVYDASGARLRKVTDAQAAAGSTAARKAERIYLGAFELYREYDAAGTTVTLERETLHIMDERQRVALVDTRTAGSDGSPAQLVRYELGNHIGSACVELDDQARLISYEEYYPHGATAYQAVTGQIDVPKRYRYAGKERDDENGFYFLGARYYASWLGRWTSADPAGLADGPNLYAYAHNAPIRLSDPNGLNATPNQVFGDHDVVHQIATIQKPYDVSEWWANNPKKNPDAWSGPLSSWEQGYIDAMTSPTVPSVLQMRTPVDPAHLTAEEAESAAKLFGTGPDAAGKYANYENRRRIIANYVYTHPATVRLQLGLYRLFRDINPIHFAFERGWQVGSGKEMFTGSDVSRLGAAAEFFAALAIGMAVEKGLGAVRPPVGTTTGPAFATPEIENAFRQAVQARAEHLMATLSNTERGPVLSAVLDTRTGRTFFGINQDTVPPKLHPLLEARYKQYLTDAAGDTPAKAGIPGAHSEISALNTAFYAREAALGRPLTASDLSEFTIHNRTLWRGQSGMVPPPCPNCAAIIPPGVRVAP